MLREYEKNVILKTPFFITETNHARAGKRKYYRHLNQRLLTHIIIGGLPYWLKVSPKGNNSKITEKPLPNSSVNMPFY